MWPRKYATTAIAVPKICVGTCHLDLTKPSTMPVGKMMPKERIMRRICVHRMESRGSGLTAAPSGILSRWPPWARTEGKIRPLRTASNLDEGEAIVLSRDRIVATRPGLTVVQ